MLHYWWQGQLIIISKHQHKEFECIGRTYFLVELMFTLPKHLTLMVIYCQFVLGTLPCLVLGKKLLKTVLCIQFGLFLFHNFFGIPLIFQRIYIDPFTVVLPLGCMQALNYYPMKCMWCEGWKQVSWFFLWSILSAQE